MSRPVFTSGRAGASSGASEGRAVPADRSPAGIRAPGDPAIHTECAGTGAVAVLFAVGLAALDRGSTICTDSVAAAVAGASTAGASGSDADAVGGWLDSGSEGAGCGAGDGDGADAVVSPDAGCDVAGGGAGAGAGPGSAAGGAAGAGGGVGVARGGSRERGSTYVSPSPTRIPRWT
jgi:hypothetical protein